MRIIKPRMKIYITSGIGSGRTELSAFDDALFKAGVANFNLILLSSIIPPGTKVEKVQSLNWNNENYGHRLYCVLSRYAISTPGKEAWAGIGYVQADDGSGLFVEHHADNKTELVRLIDYSLEDMQSYRNLTYGKIQYIMSGIECTDRPVCALAIAAYSSQAW